MTVQERRFNLSLPFGTGIVAVLAGWWIVGLDLSPFSQHLLPLLSGVIAIVVCWFVIRFALYHIIPASDLGWVGRWLAIAFLLRIAWSWMAHLIDIYLGGTGLLTPGDPILYDRIGWSFAQAWHGGESLDYIPRSDQSGPYIYLGVIYFVFGHSVPAALAFQALVGTLTVLLIYGISRRHFDNEISSWATRLAAVFPGLLYESSSLCKDAPITMLMTLIVFLVLQANEDRDWKQMLLTAGAIFVLASFRISSAVIVSAAVAMYLQLGTGRQKMGWSAISLALITSTAAVAWWLTAGQSVGSPMTYYNAYLTANLGAISQRAKGGSLALLFTRALPVPRALLAPLFFLLTLIMPFPPFPLTFDDGYYSFFSRLTTWFWYMLLPALILGAIWVVRRKRRAALLMIGLPILYLGSVGYVWSGMIGRYRSAIYPLACVVVSVGIVRFRSLRGSKTISVLFGSYSVWVYVFLWLVLLYLLIKFVGIGLLVQIRSSLVVLVILCAVTIWLRLRKHLI